MSVKSIEKIVGIVLGLLVILWLSGLLSLWINGINYLANNVEGHLNKAIPVEGEYVVQIDLSDLKSNEGKILFDNGNNQIYLSKVFVENNTDYEVIFRSSGTYSLGTASLVSGIEHAYTNDGFTDIFHAEAKATYRGDTFVLSQSTSSGLNYRDGDEFGFYLFPTNDEIDINLEKDSIIEVTITNLYLNIWMKKP